MKTYTKYLIFAVCFAVLLSLDLMTKAIFDGKVLQFIPGFISINGTVHNYGAGWSLFKNAQVLFVILAFVFVIGFVLFEIFNRKQRHWTYYVGICLVLGGAMGNAIDRICFGYVRDFIQLEFINFPVFNLADSFLTVGAVFFAVFLIFFSELKNDKKKELPQQNQNLNDKGNLSGEN